MKQKAMQICKFGKAYIKLESADCMEQFEFIRDFYHDRGIKFECTFLKNVYRCELDKEIKLMPFKKWHSVSYVDKVNAVFE